MLRARVAYFSASPIVRAGALACAYFASAELGHVLSLNAHGQSFATIWPAAGILLATLVLTPWQQWPLMLLAACGANVASDVLLHGKTLPVSLGFCLANCGEASIGAWLLHKFVGRTVTMASIKDVVGVALGAALISTMYGAAIGAAVVSLAYDVSYWSAWRVWWIADASGVLLMAPLVFAWISEHEAIPSQRRRSWLEGAVVFLAIALIAEAVYGEWLPPEMTVPIFILPALLWAGKRFGPRGATLGMLLAGVIGVENVIHGRGPYTVFTSNPLEQLMRAQAVVVVCSISIFALAAIVAERNRAEEQKNKLIGELEQALVEIKTLRGFIPICAWCRKIRDDQGFWKQLEDYLQAHTEATLTHGICPDCMHEQTTPAGKKSA
jgi:integral membrane sensor domain MASE1